LYRTEITSASGNILIADEPPEIGGKNLGSKPNRASGIIIGFLHRNYFANVHQSQTVERIRNKRKN
jgi:hypothetical protein